MTFSREDALKIQGPNLAALGAYFRKRREKKLEQLAGSMDEAETNRLRGEIEALKDFQSIAEDVEKSLKG